MSEIDFSIFSKEYLRYLLEQCEIKIEFYTKLKEMAVEELETYWGYHEDVICMKETAKYIEKALENDDEPHVVIKDFKIHEINKSFYGENH